MATLVQRINDLSLAQQQVIADIQRVQQQFIDQTPAGLAVGVEALNLDQAMTTWASLDATGQVVRMSTERSPTSTGPRRRRIASKSLACKAKRKS